MSKSRRTKFELPLHLALMLLFAIAATFPLLFMNQLPAAISATPEGTSEALVGDSNHSPADPFSIEERSYLASYAFLNREALNRHSLLWNPLEFCGVPFFANVENRVLSPFSVPFHFLPLDYAFKLSIWLKLFIAACTAYYTARRVGLSPPLSLFTATSYQLSAGFLLFQISPISDTAPLLPLLYLFSERAAVGQLRYWPLAALVTAAMILGGSLAAVAAAFIFFGLYAALLYTILEKGKPPLLPITALVLSLVVGIAISSGQLWPYWQFLNQTSPVNSTGTDWIPGVESLINAVVVSGGTSRGNTLLHVGLLHLLFLVLWGASRHCVLKPHRIRVDLLYALSLMIYGIIALHTVFQFSFIHHPMAWLLPTSLALAINSAAVADTWLTLNPEQCNSVLRRLGVMILGITVSVAMATAIIFLQSDGSLIRLVLLFALSAIIIVAFFVLLGRTLLAPSHTTMGYVTVGIIAFEQLITFHSAQPHFPLRNLQQEPEFAAAVKSMGGRAGGKLAQYDVPLSVYGIQQTDAYQGRALNDYQTFLVRANADPLLYTQTASATLLLSRDDIQGPFSELRPYLHVHDVSSDGTILFQSLSPTKRVNVIYDGRYTGRANTLTPSSSLPALLGADIPFEQPPETPQKATLISVIEPDSFLVDVDGCGPGVLVLSDSYAPGWKARIDGEESQVFSVDNAFRGVSISADSQSVEFYYDPASIQQGRFISIGAGVLILLGMLNLMYFRLHNRYMRV